MSSLLEDAVLQLRKEMPLQLVVNMFQKMVSLYISVSGLDLHILSISRICGM